MFFESQKQERKKKGLKEYIGKEYQIIWFVRNKKERARKEYMNKRKKQCERDYQ